MGRVYSNQAQQQTTETISIGLVNSKAQWVHDNILPSSSHPESIKYRVLNYCGVHPTIQGRLKRLSRKVPHDLESVKDRLHDHHAACTTIPQSGLSTNALGPTRGPMKKRDYSQHSIF
jgi:hypothetical protein